MSSGNRLPPLGSEVWEFNAFKGGDKVYGSWAMRGAHEVESASYLAMLADGKYDRVVVTYHERGMGT